MTESRRRCKRCHRLLGPAGHDCKDREREREYCTRCQCERCGLLLASGAVFCSACLLAAAPVRAEPVVHHVAAVQISKQMPGQLLTDRADSPHEPEHKQTPAPAGIVREARPAAPPPFVPGRRRPVQARLLPARPGRIYSSWVPPQPPAPVPQQPQRRTMPPAQLARMAAHARSRTSEPVPVAQPASA